MKVDTMRIIDKWAGIPLTFLLSLLIWLYEKLFFIQKKPPNLRRTLFIELSEMGSAVLADPAMRKLKNHGNPEIFFAIFKNNAISLQILKTVSNNHIFEMRSENLFVLIIDTLRFIFWCRSNKITTVIDLELFSRFTALLSGLSGASSRIGFGTYHDEGLYRGFIVNFPVRYNSHVHISVNFISLVNRASNKFENPYATETVHQNDLKLSQADMQEFNVNILKEKITELYSNWENKRIVLFNPNASDLLPQRRWLPEYFAQVGKDILNAMDDVLILATGAPSERDFVQKVVDDINHERCINSAGIFEFLELIPLYSFSSLLLTNDSGPAHFASVTPLKIFVIMGPETPALYGPMGNAEVLYLGLPCSPCISAYNHRKTTCVVRPCITEIKPEWVTGKIKKYLGSTY